MTLEKIANEVRGRLEGMVGTNKEIREQIMEQLVGTYQFTEISLIHILMHSPEAGIEFTLRVQDSLGAVNDVMFKEFGLEPVHIKELELAVVDTLEEVFGMDIDTLFEKVRG